MYTIYDGPAVAEPGHGREKGEKGRKVENGDTSSYQLIGTKQDAKRPIDTHTVHSKSRGIEST